MKKILSVLTAAVISAAMTVSAFAASGDLNGDGEVNILDVVSARAYIIGSLELTDEQIKAADTNDDGEISIIDVVKMRSIIINSVSKEEPIHVEKLANVEKLIKSEKMIELFYAQDFTEDLEFDSSMLADFSFKDALNDEALAEISEMMGLDEPITVEMLVNDFKINDLIDCIAAIDFTGFEEWLDTIDLSVMEEYNAELAKINSIEDYDEWSAAYDKLMEEYEPKLEKAMNTEDLMAWMESIDTTGFEAWAESIGISGEDFLF